MLTCPIFTVFEPHLTSLALTSYLDPGTGSYALQLLLAGLFGGMFALKQSWQQIKAWMARFAPARLNPQSPLEGTD